jgi:hypothetical protein
MHFDLARIAETDAYKLLVSTVVPRPIALATTVDGDGRVNAAPFSFFNAVSSIPPVVVLGISPGAGNTEDGYKDTERNIRETGEFVVNLVDEAIAERMNICAVDFPTEIGELEDVTVKGGVIVAWGATDIYDPASELHRRFEIGVTSTGGFHSVDPGKLTMAPYFADICAARIAGESPR